MEDILRLFRGFDMLGPTPVSIIREVGPTRSPSGHFQPLVACLAQRILHPQFTEARLLNVPGSRPACSPLVLLCLGRIHTV